MKRLLYILRPVLIALLPLLLTLAPAKAQTIVYTGDTTPLGVVVNAGDNTSWELYSDGSVDFAKVPGNCPASSADFVGGNIGSNVNVKWFKPGIYFFKVTVSDVAGCASNFKIGMIEVKVAVQAVIISPTAAVCEGTPISLEIDLSGTAPWDFTYQGKDIDGNTTTPVTITGVAATPYTLIIDPGPTKTTDYQVTKVSDINGENKTGSNPVTQQVNSLPTPSAIYHN